MPAMPPRRHVGCTLGFRPVADHRLGGDQYNPATEAASCSATEEVTSSLTWWCVILLVFLSLLPAEDMARTGFPGELEHFVAYAGSAAIAMAGYGRNGSRLPIVGGFWR